MHANMLHFLCYAVTPPHLMAGVQQLKVEDTYQQKRSQQQPQVHHQTQKHQIENQKQQSKSQDQVLQLTKESQLQLQMNNLITQFQQLHTTVTTEKEMSERRCQSLESALVAEQEMSKSLQIKCQSLETALLAEQERYQSLEKRCQVLEVEQQRSQSGYQNQEERLKEVEDTVEQLWSEEEEWQLNVFIQPSLLNTTNNCLLKR